LIFNTRLLSLATAIPGHALLQDEVAEIALRLFGDRYRAFERMASVFGTAGIKKRYSVRPVEWFCTPRGWKERTAAYLEGAQALFVDAATKALNAAHLRTCDVDAIVTVSSTGIATPSLEARASLRMGFRDDGSAHPGLRIGLRRRRVGDWRSHRASRRRSPAPWSCSSSWSFAPLRFASTSSPRRTWSPRRCSETELPACILRAGEGGIAEIEACGEHTWPDTLDIMGWDVDSQGFEVIFAQAIPSFAEENIQPAISGILHRAGIGMNDVDRLVCHPVA